VKILVCGGAGYIGSHVAKALRLQGMEPVVFDNMSAGHEWAVQWGNLCRADLSDREAIETVLRSEKIDAVIQLAGSINVGESTQDPGKYYRNNFSISINLLEAMDAVGVRRIVFSSTAAVYGNCETVPIPEDAPKAPINTYGEAKHFVELALSRFRQARGLQAIALRYFNASGADADAEIGEMHRPETHLLPLIIYGTLGKRPPVKIFGTDYPTPDGTAIRDYIHVTDLADAHVRAVQKLCAGTQDSSQPWAMNLGTSNGVSILEAIKAVEDVSGRKVPYELAARRAGDPAVLVADAALAKDILGWTPAHSDIHSIIRTAWKWSEKALASGLYEA
jgi:UDP-glucose-4-epimerase GalE